jgi:hypothetical protein
MANSIVILEDTEARVVAMRRVLNELLPQCEQVVFDNATDFIDWINEHLADAILICLDHDLGPTRMRDGKMFDPGIGRDVADVLATCPVVCSVIVHSSNSVAVPGMLRVLRESGWKSSAVTPSDDLSWIDTIWREEIETYIRTGWIVTE